MKRNQYRTRKVFLATNGEGPWPCSYCGEMVTQLGRHKGDGNIHHADHDESNDDPSNLLVAHTLCHQRHHHYPMSDEMKAQISKRLKGKPSPTKGMTFSKAVNAKKGRRGPLNATFGRTHTEEERAKMRGPRPAIHTCPDCGRLFSKNWLSRHKNEDRCA